MMNSYNDLIMPNNTGPPMQKDYHPYSNNNSHELSYTPEHFMPPSAAMGPQSVQNRHMNMMQHQQPPPAPPPPPPHPHNQAAMHQVYYKA